VGDGRWLSDVISWLDDQGGFTQGIAVSVVLAVGAGAWSFVQWGWRKRRAYQSTRRDSERATAQEIEADFCAGAAGLGIVDQAVNSTASSDAILEQLRLSMGPIQNIVQLLAKEIPARLPEAGTPDYVARKQAALREGARALHPHVQTLEAASRNVVPCGPQFVHAFRAVFELPVTSDGDRRVLANLREIYAGGVAQSFRMLATLIGKRREGVALFDGKQQDLSRMVRRAVVAMDEIQRAADQIATFCEDEMPSHIDRLLGPASGDG
jgi:hypothetical protein